MSQTLSWGIIGTGRIAGIFANGLTKSQTGKLVAVGSRTQEAADRFGATWNVAHCYHSYEDLLADDEVQAVYISTPHPMHAEWAIKAAEAGKHILCEKPIALNHAGAMAVIEAAQRNDVFLMEAFMYRSHPQIARLTELLQTGTIGDVQLIQASFAFRSGFNPESRLLQNALGGGGILDVGCYCTSMARLVAGIAVGKPFADPIQVTATGHIGAETGVDEYTVASLAFPGAILAQLLTGVRLNAENHVRIYGSEGSITLTTPWNPPAGQATQIVVQRADQTEIEQITIECPDDLYSLEADTVAAHIQERQSPTVSWEDTLGNMRTLDQWREAIGLSYNAEQPQGADQHLPVHKRPLAVHAQNIMKYGQIAGVEKPVSRLVMGVDNQTIWSHAVVMFDDFFEQGGNCFDSAYIYGRGRCEEILGQWIKNRGVREQVVILDKGAHTPNCNPQALHSQFMESLDRLQTDYVDVYMMHRDNPNIPVGEFITVLNEHKNAGRMRAFGASNWSIERIQEANEWAAAHGLVGFSAISNNFSLARMVDPVWAGCIAASDAQSRAWLEQTQMPIMPWSSQARGFFTGRAHPDDRSDAELVRCWYSSDNFQRLERVNQMAQERGVLPINIALAYVLNQPFPTFPLIGPRLLSETRTSLPALTVELTPEELRWLNLEA
ncbi:aldo/keto reductase [Dictyobacter arantiisoli]|uniref:Oxidoreductase n=1 Tax=Dictyobacter arantiisoli TaxID=2014874 RepID=A0A5A5T9Y1_9CHLR|nr:aldo/keto reductase [Dictyobacter arantiisoli]GCF07823.1 oxidoreductase [Dictyobacter arantiisoli]